VRGSTDGGCAQKLHNEHSMCSLCSIRTLECLCKWPGTITGGRGVYEGACVHVAAESAGVYKRYIMSTQSTHYVPFVHDAALAHAWDTQNEHTKCSFYVSHA
jgi:hypothetical protein